MMNIILTLGDALVIYEKYIVWCEYEGHLESLRFLDKHVGLALMIENLELINILILVQAQQLTWSKDIALQTMNHLEHNYYVMEHVSLKKPMITN